MNSPTIHCKVEKFTGYIKTVVTNARNDYLKKLIRVERCELPVGEPDLGAYQGAKDIDQMILRAALKEQPLIRQQILLYSYFCGYTTSEIARMLQCSQGYVNRQKKAALLALRIAMEGGGDDA